MWFLPGYASCLVEDRACVLLTTDGLARFDYDELICATFDLSLLCKCILKFSLIYDLMRDLLENPFRHNDRPAVF